MNKHIQQLVELAFLEDLEQQGDHSAKASIPTNATSRAQLIVKDDGIIAGVELAKAIFNYYDDTIQFTTLTSDGTLVKYGDIAFTVSGKAHTLLSVERIVLNFMQRMSGIATLVDQYQSKINHTNAKVLDTRKTTPGLRWIEKWAVRIGGGTNHRMGLYDMIMLKDNHIDYAGGIKKAIQSTINYLNNEQLNLPIEIETRSIKEVEEVLSVGGVQRIMLDNFTPEEVSKAVKLIQREYETEASGGITLQTIVDYAETGVDYISVGALTHSVKSLDLSLKAY